MIVGQKLLRLLGGLELKHEVESNAEPAKEDEEAGETGRRVEDEVCERSLVELCDSVLLAVNVQAGIGLASGGLCLRDSGHAGAAADASALDAAVDFRAFKGVVVNDDRGAEHCHDEDVIHKDDQSGKDPKRPGGRDGGSDGAEKCGARGGRGDKHRRTGTTINVAHPCLQVARDCRALEGTLLVGVHEDKDVVRPDGRHNEQAKRVERRKVVNLEQPLGEEPRSRDGKDNFKEADVGEEPGAEHEAHVKVDDGDGDHGEHAVVGQDLEEDVQDEDSHEVVGVDLVAVARIGDFLHILEESVHDKLLPLVTTFGVFFFGIRVDGDPNDGGSPKGDAP
mmetsp:Transcript_2075/g.3738  ORF Transcript_2075/g.3738 Transcript_2075/m.3738 type:complete len:337 (-) Transcript_2075:62-1072(-)